MQGTIHIQHLPKFQPLLNEGSIYVIIGFEVTKSNPRFKLTDFKNSIRFNQTTTMVLIDDSFTQIPKDLFRFRTHDQLLSLANTNKDLPDVIGAVCSSKAYRNESTLKIERLLVYMCLQSEKVLLSAFDDHAAILNSSLEKKATGTCIMLATNINPNFFWRHSIVGEMYLNATSATHFYFDAGIQATHNFAERDTKNNSDVKYSGVQKIEQSSIAELNHYHTTSITQDAEFFCTTKVVGS
ncbi:unnamed protein product [Thlaspi arvense]|uniref:Uncharacterized protein n=1 Tax=Thlaspi arvense TaxID=13288 RepID=A0AAU9RVR2_THLAR|nr:unnamed protein product [Thlaspi arvense]